MTRSWLDRPEGGSAFALRFLVAVALGLGRTIARMVLLPVTAYFMIRRGPERRASRDYLTRVLGRQPGLFEIARHFHTFAGVTLDRVYFLKGSLESFDTRMIGIEKLHRAMAGGQGVLLLGAHAGSFDSLRALSLLRPDATVRVVLDAGHSPVLSAILSELNPRIAAGIINPRQSGVSVALEIGSALARGELVTMLADRGRPGHEVVEVDFLGESAGFPLAPWQIASVMHVPVVFCIGLYRGGNRYDVHFELLADALQVDRQRRREQLHAAIQDFANRLAERIRVAPYNWFNFYDFWDKD